MSRRRYVQSQAATTAPSAPPEVAALTSDVWYTLLYLRTSDQRAIERARLRVWSDPLLRAGRSAPQVARAVADLERWARHAESHGRTPTIGAQATWLARRNRTQVDGDEMGEALDRLMSRAPVRVAPGARTALVRLRDEGVRLGLISNVLHETGDGLRRLLDSLGLLELFEVAVISSEHPWSKPSPRPFRLAVARLGVRPRQAVHIGDLGYDVLGARRAGVHPILFTGLHRYEPARTPLASALAGGAVETAARWSEVPGRVLARPN